MRGKLAVRNTLMSMLSILISIVIGMVVPRVILAYYGSETNGLVSSINQFLNYITILESGVGAIVVASLYSPFASRDYAQISRIISKSKSFFHKLVAVFLIYALILILAYPQISSSSLDKVYVSALVAVLAITLFIQYGFTIHYSLLLQAAQRYYIASLTSMVLQVVNAAVTILLITQGADILTVKFISSIVFMLNPLILRKYVKKNYPEIQLNVVSDYVIPQKRDTLIHNLSYVIHNNTDIVLITLFLGVKDVSVYAVYNMIVSSIRKLMESLSSGTQAAFGDMLAHNEISALQTRFAFFEHLVILLTSIIFTTTACLILPFVEIYTAGIKDIQYIRPLFGFLLVSAEAVYIFRLPYHTLVKASAAFRETKNGAIGETLINLIVSLVLLRPFGLAGVAIGTLLSMVFRTVYYIFFFRNRILFLSSGKSLCKISLNVIIGIVLTKVSGYCIPYAAHSNLFVWTGTAAILICLVSLVFLAINALVYKKDTLLLLQTVCRKIMKHV